MSRKALIEKIGKLGKGKIRRLVKQRLKEFRGMRKKTSREIFPELCFCILTANYSAEGAMKVQEKIGNGFNYLSEKRLAGKLRETGYRYPNARAGYIAEARRHEEQVEKIVKGEGEFAAREWLVENVKGLGCKEASHFLRNMALQLSMSLAELDLYLWYMETGKVLK